MRKKRREWSSSLFSVEKYDAEVKLAVFDFENDDFDKLPADLKNIDVGILRKLGWKSEFEMQN